MNNGDKVKGVRQTAGRRSKNLSPGSGNREMREHGALIDRLVMHQEREIVFLPFCPGSVSGRPHVCCNAAMAASPFMVPKESARGQPWGGVA